MNADVISDVTPIARKRVLIIAYAFSPTLGSEYRAAWEMVHQIARHHDVTVLFGDSDEIMGGFARFDEYAATNALPFTAVKVQSTARQQWMAQRMLRMPWALFFGVLLRSWHRLVFTTAQRLHAAAPFDVVHQLGAIGFRNPGYSWKLGCHSCWGPIGGAQFIDTRMIKTKVSSYYVEALLRNFSLRLQAFSPYIAAGARGFTRLAFATPENAAYFRSNFARFGPVISEQGIDRVSDVCKQEARGTGSLRVVFAGSLIPRKNIAALINIIAKAPEGICFDVVGGGPLAADVAAAASQRSNVTFHGKLPRPQLMEILKASDVILLTSLSEGNPAILFEALEKDCIPVVPHINGFASTLNTEVAFLIPQDSYQGAVDFSVAALAALRDPAVRQQYKSAVAAHRDTLTWERLAQAHMAQYA